MTESGNTRIKVCLVIPSLQAGGMERVMSELIGYFTLKKDVELHLILYGMSREIFYPVPGDVVIHTPAFRFNQKWRLACTFKTLLFLRKKIKEIVPETILSFGEYWNSFVLIASFGLKYPVYVSDRCSPEKKFGKFHGFLRKVLYPNARGIVAQTGKASEIYSSQFRHSNIGVIGNPIRKIAGGPDSIRQNIVLMVGRLIRSKNQDKLIELFLKINMPGWKLVIVGYDHLKQSNFERLQSIITLNNAEDKVILAGKQSDVDSYYSMSKIFAFTSVSEGFPNAIGEAMSAGVPAVAFDCVAGPSEMIKDGINGFLVTAGDYDKFREKLESLMRNEEMRISFGENARKDIDQFSIDSIGEQYLKFILGKTVNK